MKAKYYDFNGKSLWPPNINPQQLIVQFNGSQQQIDELMQQIKTGEKISVTLDTYITCRFCGGDTVRVRYTSHNRHHFECPKCDTDVYLNEETEEGAIEFYNQVVPR